MIELSTYDKVRRLVAYATGEECGDGEIVSNIVSGYAEPGYGPSDAVVVLGNWNPRNVPGEDRWHSSDPRVTLPARLARSLERVGAEIEWLDEWIACGECYRAVRTAADSHSWKPAYAFVNECEIYCHDCLREMGEDALEEYVNNSDRCVTWCEPAHVESLGFVKWEPGNEHTYASGWHPRQDDKPDAILAAILQRQPAARVVFFLDESSQFYIRFSAYIRTEEDES